MPSWKVTLAALSFAGLPAADVFAAEEMTRVDTIGDWLVLADSKKPHAFCFVTSEAKSSEPKDTPREPPRAYISVWPKDGIKGEVSFRMGFKVKKQGEGIAKINASGYRLFGANDRAFVKDATQELKLLEAMKKGGNLTVEIASDRGVTVTDKYSLNGVGPALQKLQQTCF